MRGTVYPTGNSIEVQIDTENAYSVISRLELNRISRSCPRLDPGPPNVPIIVNLRKPTIFLGFYRIHFVTRNIYFNELCAVIESQTPGLFLNKIPEHLRRFVCASCRAQP